MAKWEHATIETCLPAALSAGPAGQNIGRLSSKRSSPKGVCRPSRRGLLHFDVLAWKGGRRWRSGLSLRVSRRVEGGTGPGFFSRSTPSPPASGAAAMILPVGPATRIFLAAGTSDLRKSFEGLSDLVSHTFAQDPLSGHLFVFVNRRKNRIRLLYADGSGVWLCAKRLHGQSTFAWPKTTEPGAFRILTITTIESPEWQNSPEETRTFCHIQPKSWNGFSIPK